VGPGHPHQLINCSGAPIRYLCLSALQTPEVAIYPDSGKAGFTVGVSLAGVSSRQFQRLGESLPYYSGEDG
jgi:uncharacterized cupin superfamily protein